MCWSCDHPDATWEEYEEHLQGLMADRGWMVQAVEGTRVHAPFAYTVGLTPLGLPELVVTGLDAQTSAELLNEVADYVLNESLILPGETMQCGPWLLEAVHVENPDAHLYVAVDMFGPPFVRGLQLAWADPQGRWPWDAGHGGQPVLGERNAKYCDAHKPPVPRGQR